MGKLRNRSIELLVITISSIVYLSVFSAFSSPLFPHYYKYDSAIFMMIGKALLDGKVMYTDIFDNKGPFL